MELSDKLIEELRIQSERDFREAENLMKNNGSVEHIAWFCEQSYEKIMKSVYAYFKLKIQNGNVKSVYDKIYEKQHYDSYKLILNMFREMVFSFRQSLDGAVSKVKTSSQVTDSTITGLSSFLGGVNLSLLNKQLESQIVKTNETIEQRISSANAFRDFLYTSTVQTLQKSIGVFNVEEIVKKKLDELSKNPIFRSSDPLVSMALDTELKNVQRHVKFYSFLSTTLILAAWLLPHTSMSRYPILDYNLDNLRSYREREIELRGFFDFLINRIRSLYPDSVVFIEMMQEYKRRGIITSP